MQNNFQEHTNQLRSEKERIRSQLQRDIDLRNLQKHTTNNIVSETLSTTPNNQRNSQQQGQHRPRLVEVSGLTGHRLDNEPESLQEGFTGIGNILNQTPSYNFSNNFFPPGVLQEQVTKERTDDFRKFIDNQRADEERIRQVAVAENDLLKTNTFSSASKMFLDDSLSKVDTSKDPFNQPFENTRYNKVRKSVVNIDSAHRDFTLYPDSNNYHIRLPRQYQHVKEVTLVSSEIPNTYQVVRGDSAAVKRSKNRRKYQCGELLNDANNNFYWNLAEDAPSTGNARVTWDCIVYNAPLTPGNYVAIDCNCGEVTIQSEIQNQVQKVNHYSDGTPTTFLVNIDIRTNIVTIQSIESNLLEVNPLSTQSGTNIITVSQLNHGYTKAGTDQVTILGATSVGGVPDTQLNTTHTIQAILSVNAYELRVSTIAQATATGGGANITAGKQKPMKLLFSNLDTIGKILGFPQQDSSDPLSRNIEFIDTDPTDLSGNPTIPGEIPAQIKTTRHGLIPGDTILISDTTTIPIINGIHTVTRVISPDVFEIGVKVKVVHNQTTTLSTRIGKVKQSLDATLTNVTQIKPQQFGEIQLGNAHLYSLGTGVFIANVVSGILVNGASINGVHTVTKIPSANSFAIEKNIEYGGNFGNAIVFPTTTTALVPISGIIPQNNGVFTPYPVEPIYTGSDVPSYVILRDFDTQPDVNIDVNVNVDAVYVCGTTTTVPTTTSITQTFTADTSCVGCHKQLLNIWIRVGTPSTIGMTGRLGLYIETFPGSGIYNQLNNDLTPVPIVNDTAAGTNFSVSSSFDLFLTPGVSYQWRLLIQGGLPADSVNVCGNFNFYNGGRSNIAPNHSYEFRVYSSANIQQIDYYSITTGRFNVKTPVTNVIMETITQNYFRSLSSQLQFIQDATVKSNGIFQYSVQHNLLPGDYFYVRRKTTPYRTTESIISPNMTGVQIVTNNLNNYKITTNTDIISSSFSTSSLLSNLVTIKTINGNAPIAIQNIYPFNNGYFCSNRSTCDISRRTCLLCPDDYIFIRNSNLNESNGFSGKGDTGGVLSTTLNITFVSGNSLLSGMTLIGTGITPGNYIVSQSSGPPGGIGTYVMFIAETLVSTTNIFGVYSINGCQRINQIYSNVSTICDDLFDLQILVDSTATSTPGEYVRLDTFKGVDGQNSVFNLATVINTALAYDPTITILTIQTSSIHLLELGDAIYCNTLQPVNINCSISDLITMSIANLDDTIEYAVPDVTNQTIFYLYVPTTSGIVNGDQFYYHKICGSSFIPIIQYFYNSYNGLIEAQNNNLSVGTNIYVGKSTTTPLINGFNASGFNITIINSNFIGWFGSPIVTGNIGQPFAGEFVIPSLVPELTVLDVTPQNNGVIIADNTFLGGELVYFTNDTNINVGLSSDLRDKTFTVSTDNLTSTQFSLVGTPITFLDELFGNSIIATISIIETVPTPTPVQFTLPPGTTEFTMTLLGAGGGTGQKGSGADECSGGTGGRIVATFQVGAVGSLLDIEIGDTLEVTVGEAGKSGVLGGEGGAVGGGGSSGFSPSGIYSKCGGGGGGYSRLYNVTQAKVLAVAGGGGGGGSHVTGSVYPKGGNGTGADSNSTSGRGGDGNNTGTGSVAIIAGGNYGATMMGLLTGTPGAGGNGYQASAVGTVGNSTLALAGGGIQFTTINVSSNNFSLPQPIIYVNSMPSIFVAPGSISVTTSLGVQHVNFTGIVGNSFTGCTLGVGLMSTGNLVSPVIGNGGEILSTTIAAGSAGMVLPINTINVESTDGILYYNSTWNGSISATTLTLNSTATGIFYVGAVINGTGVIPGTTILSKISAGSIGASGTTYLLSTPHGIVPNTSMYIATGYVSVVSTAGVQNVRYTGFTTTTILGCTGGTGTVLLGNLVSPIGGLSGGGGGGGVMGGGGGGGKTAVIFGGTPPTSMAVLGAAAAGGGGSGFLHPSASNATRDSLGAPSDTNGSMIINIKQNIVGFGAGHFAHLPTNETTSHNIITVDPASNATFISTQTTGFPAPTSSVEIFMTDGSFGDTDIAQIKDKLTQASAFKTPAPSYSLTDFTTDLIVTTSDIDLNSGVLQMNNVDIISTSDARFPGLKGLGWVRVSGNVEPITNIIRDSTGKIIPTNSALSVNDKVHFVSNHTTVPDMNGTFNVRYVDLGNTVPKFFELSNLTLTAVDGPITPATNIVYFRTTITANTTDGCVTINEIATGCPATIRATAHGFPIGSNVNVVILATDTKPPIDVANAGVIVNAQVLTEDFINLPKKNYNLNGDLVDICNLTVVNQTNVFTAQRGRWSQQILSTNCGVPSFQIDTANAQTIVTTTQRVNLDYNLMFTIDYSNPVVLGSTTIYVNLPPGYSSLPMKNGQAVIISGHTGANPVIDGTYKIYQLSGNSFKIPIASTVFSTGGTGGYVTMKAPTKISGHGLYTGDKVLFENTKTSPNINQRIFKITKIDDTRFSIPIVLNSLTNTATSSWCTNVINLRLVDHGLKTGDLFFLYGATAFAGLQLNDINTIHGDKRQNVVTSEEKQTRKFARVIDANTLQFEALAFPEGRTMGGGYDICISASNHNKWEQAGNAAPPGYIYKNYGFNSLQTNLNCNGDLNNFIDLHPEPYILMTSEKLTNILDTGSLVDKIFAKIQLSTAPGETLYNTFVSAPKTYENPDKVLDEIDVQFYRRDGKPFDFLGMNHSFSLEILEYQDRLLGTNIQSGRMKEDRGPVSQQGFVESTISGFHPEQNLLTPANATSLQQSTNLTQRINAP